MSPEQFEFINRKLNYIHQEITKMASTTVTRAEFDAALDSAVTTIQTAISDLEAKIAAGSVSTPEDFSAELSKLQGLVSTATSADPGPAAPTSTPTT